jgi:hypothetical protein
VALKVSGVQDALYCFGVGHISPAGVEPAKSGLNPALSRNCEAPSGDEPGRLPHTDECRPSTEGRFVRQAPPVLLRSRGGVRGFNNRRR